MCVCVGLPFQLKFAGASWAMYGATIFNGLK